MTRPWIAEWDDMGGPYVFDSREVRAVTYGATGFSTELEAWEHVLDCMVERRQVIASSITEARAAIRRLKRLDARKATR